MCVQGDLQVCTRRSACMYKEICMLIYVQDYVRVCAIELISIEELRTRVPELLDLQKVSS